jgi:acetyltransferase
MDAEFGVIVRSELKGTGLGLLLMQKIIGYLRTQGTQRLVATVLDSNQRMLKLASDLGFVEDVSKDDGEDIKAIYLPLT